MSLADEMESYEAIVSVAERTNDLVKAIKKRLRTLDPDNPVALILASELHGIRSAGSEFNYMATEAWKQITREFG
jgi:hypothetical protein